MRKLIFEDHFLGTTPDEKNWTLEVLGSGFGNKEDQFYTARTENVFTKDSILHIVARKEDYEHRKYTSAKLVSRHKFSFQYGKIEVRMKLPKGVGTWPAFWLLGDNIKEVGWPKCGEIDLMEYVGKDPDHIHFSLHSQNYNHGKGNNPYFKKEVKGISDDFHVFTLDWDQFGFKYYLDNQLLKTELKGDKKSVEDWPFDQKFYMIINLAIGGTWGGAIDDSIFPTEFLIDYVKVYE